MAVWLPVIDTLFRSDLILIDEVGCAPLTTPAFSCSALSRLPTNAAPWHRQSLAVRAGARRLCGGGSLAGTLPDV